MTRSRCLDQSAVAVLTVLLLLLTSIDKYVDLLDAYVSSIFFFYTEVECTTATCAIISDKNSGLSYKRENYRLRITEVRPKKKACGKKNTVGKSGIRFTFWQLFICSFRRKIVS